jgi:hypothetical protein
VVLQIHALEQVLETAALLQTLEQVLGAAVVLQILEQAIGAAAVLQIYAKATFLLGAARMGGSLGRCPWT